MTRKLTIVALAMTLLAGAASAMTLDEIIARNLEARGGKDKLAALTSVRITGTVHMANGMEAPLTWTWKRPDKVRSEIVLQGMTMIQAFDGTKGWMVVPFGGNPDPQEMPEDQRKRMEEQADFDGPFIDTEKKGYTLELVGKETVEGTEAWVVRVTDKHGEQSTIYLDAEYFLPFKQVAKRTIRGQEMEISSSIGDYKEVDGLLFPFSTEVTVKGTPHTESVTFEKIELNVPVDDSLFEMPSTPEKAETPAASKK